MALTGATYCWGFNGSGQLGDGTTTQRLTPTQVNGGLTFTTLAAGSTHTCGVTGAGVALCWGRNSSGQLGISGVPNPVAGGIHLRVP